MPFLVLNGPSRSICWNLSTPHGPVGAWITPFYFLLVAEILFIFLFSKNVLLLTFFSPLLSLGQVVYFAIALSSRCIEACNFRLLVLFTYCSIKEYKIKLGSTLRRTCLYNLLICNCMLALSVSLCLICLVHFCCTELLLFLSTVCSGFLQVEHACWCIFFVILCNTIFNNKTK